MANLILKVLSLFNSPDTKVNNMYTHKAEQHYFELYYPTIKQYLAPHSNLLDIGCQNGRFTIPLANEGHTLTATDIDDTYFEFIQSHISDSKSINFHKEQIIKSISRLPQGHFDGILCLELLYTMHNTPELLRGLLKLIKPKGLLITSHRPLGFYIYQYIKEKNFRALFQMLNDKHPAFNAQTPEALRELYTKAGYYVEEIKPIGMFSGFSKDPFLSIANPELMEPSHLDNLSKLESNPQLQSMFANNARYLLVVARANN